MNSMTGFGGAEERLESVAIHVRLSAVNRKHLDLRLSLPRELSFLEPDIRARIGESIQRGTVTLQADLSPLGSQAGEPRADLALGRAYLRELRRMADDLGLDATLTIRDLLHFPDLVPLRRHELGEAELRAPAMAAFEAALSAFQAMRQREGETLKADTLTRCGSLADGVARITTLAPRQPEQLRERLYQRARDLIEGLQVDDERLMKEVIFCAERSDITEELVRLGSHLDQLRDMLHAAEPIGRKLDFLLQEIGREINTIGSKSNDREIAGIVIDMKTELDRMREQAQNIE